MDEALKNSRVILHVDLVRCCYVYSNASRRTLTFLWPVYKQDAFYCQVEHVRLGIPKDVPLCVQQWSGLIAVNYAARAKGIKRHCNVAEALVKCPEVKFVHVATYADGDDTAQYHTEGITYQTHKVSLDPYRRASEKIMAIFERFCPKYQRASIDEAFLDMTELINSRILSLYAASEDEEDPEDPVVDWEGAGVLVGEQVRTSTGWRDLQLRLAADLSSEIRAAVFAELHYTCSTGIAHNKTLAKLCSGMNKPDKQVRGRTYLVLAEVLPLMRELPMANIRNLGGKLGAEVEAALGVPNAGDLWHFSLEALQAKFGEGTGTWLYNICRGICHDEVNETSIPKSMMACKALRPGITQFTQLNHWLGILSTELYTRLMNDHKTHARWPRTLTLHTKTAVARGASAVGSERSKRADLPPFHGFTRDSVRDRCLTLLQNPRWPLDRIAVGVSSFETIESGIQPISSFFTKGPVVPSISTPSPSKNDPGRQPLPLHPPPTAPKTIESFFRPAPENAPAPLFPASIHTDTAADVTQLPTEASSLVGRASVSQVKAAKSNNNPNIAAFFSSAPRDSSAPSPETRTLSEPLLEVPVKLPISEVPLDNIRAQRSSQPIAPIPEFQPLPEMLACDQCGASILASSLPEHQDWHTALALHDTFRAENTSSLANRANTAKRKHPIAQPTKPRKTSTAPASRSASAFFKPKSPN
ncbi:DNA-directed DNA polymerase eta rad30 [Thoreauomyces humboldtii]|nr:DNA-directed DNA polymerase eta rad30 [Thoreauomyces humboldtii]